MWDQMSEIDDDAGRSHQLEEKKPRISLAEIARSSCGGGDGATVNEAIEEVWKLGVAHAVADGILSQAEETRLREFRDRLAQPILGLKDLRANTHPYTNPDKGVGQFPSPNLRQRHPPYYPNSAQRLNFLRRQPYPRKSLSRIITAHSESIESKLCVTIYNHNLRQYIVFVCCYPQSEVNIVSWRPLTETDAVYNVPIDTCGIQENVA